MRNLSNKYRPTTFSQVVGQDYTVTVLEGQLRKKDIKNGYLFTGPAGTGKTTVARMFARELNGSSRGVIEIDAASNNGVDNVRDLIENAKFKSIDTQYKIYIIDEVHMLSIGAFNALLKILEEPPKGVVFIACTTDPQKMPFTVRSRLQQFYFRRVPATDIIKKMEYICNNETIEYTREGLELIATLSNGGVRDAISYLELCSVGGVTVEVVQQCVGVTSEEIISKLLNGIISDKSEALSMIQYVWEHGGSMQRLVSDLLRYVVDVQTRVITGRTEPIEYNGSVVHMSEIIKSLIKLMQMIDKSGDAKYLIEGWVLSYDWTS